jgi:hypothetical protein
MERALPFDTLAYSKRLIEAGFTQSKPRFKLRKCRI